ncbi:MAG TPA: lytic transglycosylase domain-containing protein, partial [Xanthobacteraceae bacterium]|nr:lytic transglycosylase domain-containing protein [Xanthobacteraceae bacterium]
MRVLAIIGLFALVLTGPARAAESETVDQALCRMIEDSAVKHELPVDFFTRLIWQESSFRPHV